MVDPKIPPHGQLWVADDANVPLLVVFGGKPVAHVRSGIYMWNYMTTALKAKFHIFVAAGMNVKGTESYRIVMQTLKEHGATPSRQILYLFSGGWLPGMDLLGSCDPDLFSSIYLVDIWMGQDDKGSFRVADFYKALADKNRAKLHYIFTKGGAENAEARDYIADKAGPRAIFAKDGDHMGTNNIAIGALLHELTP